MSPSAQQIAIATACPTVVIFRNEIPFWRDLWEYEESSGSRSRVEFDPLTDLNAMHEAEKQTFVATSQWAKYGNQLQEVCHWHAVGIVPDYPRDLASLARVAHATAAQRAEAFLRCIGKWVD